MAKNYVVLCMILMHNVDQMHACDCFARGATFGHLSIYLPDDDDGKQNEVRMSYKVTY